MVLGKVIGKLLYIGIPARRKISYINLEIAFPELSKEEVESLNKDHFVTLGQGLIEAALGWWGSDAKIKKLSHIEDFHYLQDTLKNHNVILLGAHFFQPGSRR